MKNLIIILLFFIKPDLLLHSNENHQEVDIQLNNQEYLKQFKNCYLKKFIDIIDHKLHYYQFNKEEIYCLKGISFIFPGYNDSSNLYVEIEFCELSYNTNCNEYGSWLLKDLANEKICSINYHYYIDTTNNIDEKYYYWMLLKREAIMLQKFYLEYMPKIAIIPEKHKVREIKPYYFRNTDIYNKYSGNKLKTVIDMIGDDYDSYYWYPTNNTPLFGIVFVYKIDENNEIHVQSSFGKEWIELGDHKVSDFYDFIVKDIKSFILPIIN